MVREDILLTIQRTQIHEHEVHFQLKPMDAGYAIAFGNALRRVLLASLPGAAIASVQIVGVQHEFQDIPEVLEDVTDIVFNLKKVRLRCYADDPVKIHLDKQGPGEVTAGDLCVPGSVEIINPAMPLATLDNEHAHLVMELVVSTGRGFVLADTQAASNAEAPSIGVILIDALYSPVVKAHVRVEPLYQGRHDQTASIHLEITTDGTITPDEALRESATILERQLGVFADYQQHEETTQWKRPSSSHVPIPPHLYETSIEALHLSARAYNCLKRFGITRVGPILESDKTDLLGIRNVGETTIEEITKCLLTQHFIPETEPDEKVNA